MAFLRSPAPFPVILLLSACALAGCTRDDSHGAQGPRAAATSAHPVQACAPQLHDGWIRLVPGGDMPMDAGYATIENPCDAPVVVTGATSHAYADVSLHESTMENGMSRMRPVPELRIPAHAQATLKPGGLHLMLMAPRARPRAGDRVAMELRLQDGRTVDGEFDARAMTP